MQGRSARTTIPTHVSLTHTHMHARAGRSCTIESLVVACAPASHPCHGQAGALDPLLTALASKTATAAAAGALGVLCCSCAARAAEVIVLRGGIKRKSR